MYRSCVQRVLVYASETWAVRVDDMRRLERAERFMVRWMCGVSLTQRRTTRELLDSLGVEAVETVVRRGRLGWFGHVERKARGDWVSSCRELVVEGINPKGRGRNTWRQRVENNMTLLKLNKSNAQDRILWKNSVYGKRLTSENAEKGT